MVLALFRLSAYATDERGARSASPTLAASAKPDPSAATALPEAPSAAATSATFAPATAAVTERSSAESATANAAPSASLSPTDAVLAPTHALLTPTDALLAPPAALIKLKQQPRAHSFFDSRNTLGFASLGASLTADALSTQKGLAYPGFHEMNPIARPFVQTRLGAAAYNAGSFGLMAGLMYWAHKKEHHKLERILPFAVGGWEGLLSFRNYRVIANRPR